MHFLSLRAPRSIIRLRTHYLKAKESTQSDKNHALKLKSFMRAGWPTRLPASARFAIATLLVIVTYWIRHFVEAYYQGPFLLFMPTVILSALLFDRRTAFYTCLLSAVFAVYFFVEPRRSFGISAYDISQLVTLGTYTLIGLFTAYVVDVLRGMVVELESKNRQIIETEQKLHNAAKMEAIGRAVSILAHDFKNTLMPVMGSLEILKRHGPENREMLDLMEESVKSANDLVNELLAFSRGNAPRFELRDLSDLVADIIPALRESLKAGIHFSTELANDLPPVWLEPGLLRRSVFNLLLNAQDAMPGGGTITLKTYRIGKDMVGLAVTDSGAGMDKELQAKIFEPFFTTKSIGKGTGLGLPMVADFMFRAKGGIDVKSAPGKGTTIILSFPVLSAGGFDDQRREGADFFPSSAGQV